MKFKNREIEYPLDKSEYFIKIENEINSLYRNAEFENKMMDDFYEKIFYPHYRNIKKVKPAFKNVDYCLSFHFENIQRNEVGYRNPYFIDRFSFDDHLWQKAISFFNDLKKNNENSLLLNKTYIYISRLDNPFHLLINEDDILFDEKCRAYIQVNLKNHIDLLNYPKYFSISVEGSVPEPCFYIEYFGRKLFKIKYKKVKNKEEMILLISRLKQEIEQRLYHNKIFKKLNGKAKRKVI